MPNTMSHNGKLMPNLDEKSTKLLNLTVLQRIDPFVEEILITAAHVTFYEFNIDTSQWVCYHSIYKHSHTHIYIYIRTYFFLIGIHVHTCLCVSVFVCGYAFVYTLD